MPWKLLPPGRRRKRSPFWYVRGTIGGERFEVSTGKADRASAEVWAAEYVARLGRANDPSPVASFRDAAAAFIAFKRPKLDDERLIKRLQAWFGDRPVNTITHAQIVEAATALHPTGANATRNRKVVGPAAAVLHYAADQGWCSYRRIAKFKVSRKSPREPVSAADMARLMAAAEGQQRLLLALLYETGLRITDALSITWADVDLQAARLKVQISKTDERASLPLSQSLVVLLANAENKAGRLTTWTNRVSVYHWLRPLCRRLGIKYTPHLSRHALASDLLAAGVPDKAAAEYGVWRDPRSLHRYQRVRPENRPDRDVGALLDSGTGRELSPSSSPISGPTVASRSSYAPAKASKRR